jgi:hypothetical protein
MWSFHFGPLSRRARIVLHFIAGCAALCVLVGPTLFALAGAPPISSATSWTPVQLLAVRPFYDLGAHSCTRDRPLHAGPVAVEGRLTERFELQERLTTAVWECDHDWNGDVTISASIDTRGIVTGMQSAGNVSPAMQRCLRSSVLQPALRWTRGPGTLRASYFMGQPR